MKKPQPGPPPSSIKTSRALRSIWAALEGDSQQLSARLRAGIASNAEQALAADLIERKIKPRRPRPGSSRESRLVVALMADILEKAWVNRANWEKIFTEIRPGTRLSDGKWQAVKKAVGQRKHILYLARTIAASKATAVSERMAYYALKEFNAAARSQMKHIRDDGPPDELDHDTLVQIAQSGLARK
jgi:hypothetical protein